MNRRRFPNQRLRPVAAQAREATSKTDAVRQALAAGFEGPQEGTAYIRQEFMAWSDVASSTLTPQEGTAYIRQEFGIEIAPSHFSAVKSQLKKKGGTGAADGRKGKRGRPKGSKSQAVEGYLAPPPRPTASGGSDLLDAMEAMKPLIAQYGADQVKRIVDLLG
jgi:hypothetical protein